MVCWKLEDVWYSSLVVGKPPGFWKKRLDESSTVAVICLAIVASLGVFCSLVLIL